MVKVRGKLARCQLAMHLQTRETYMKHTSAFRPHLITLALLAACSAASAQVTVDTNTSNTFSDQYLQARLVPTTVVPFVDQNTSTTNWVVPSLTHTNDLASVTRDSATSTADSTASGVLSGTPLAATFTTASWASAVSDNRFSRASSGTISATSDATIDNTITFAVGQLSNYSWSATFLTTLSGNANSSTDAYIWLVDASNTPIFGCQTCANGPLSGSGQLAAGNYVLSWGGSANSTSSTSGLLGTQFGSADFTQSGVLTVAAVPEPSTVAMMLAGLAFAYGVATRRQRKDA